MDFDQCTHIPKQRDIKRLYKVNIFVNPNFMPLYEFHVWLNWSSVDYSHWDMLPFNQLKLKKSIWINASQCSGWSVLKPILNSIKVISGQRLALGFVPCLPRFINHSLIQWHYANLTPNYHYNSCLCSKLSENLCLKIWVWGNRYITITVNWEI